MMIQNENENIVFNNHVYRVGFEGRVRRCCFHCETLYLMGELELQDVKTAHRLLMTPMTFSTHGMNVCTEHYNEYYEVCKN